VWVLAGTLLGPEETGPSAPEPPTFKGLYGFRVVVGGGAGLFLLDAGPGAAHPVGCGWFGGLGCFLRTTQWTRASLIETHSFWGWVSLCDLLIVLCVQVFKGIRWMPWHQEPMKDVGACDMPRGVGNQTVIRGFPNGETWHPSWGVAAV
jgi:hypothetical protein